jgi:TPR repeat protein
MKRIKFLLFIAVLVGFAALAHAGFDEGKAAHDRGDYAKAYKEFRVLAEQGNAKAQNNLGAMYAKGQGVAQDYMQAVKWYRKSAEQGYALAQSNLGAMFYRGTGVPQDFAEAIKWYRKAAEQGNALAQSVLGDMYAEGKGVPKDDAEAVRWCRKSAEQGDAGGQSCLGAMFYRGAGVQQDFAEAVKWFHKAAEQGYAEAQKNLGVMYFKSHGVPQDFVQAYMWLNLAAAQGSVDCEKMRDLVTEKMTPVQIAEAQRLAKKWLKQEQAPGIEADSQVINQQAGASKASIPSPSTRAAENPNAELIKLKSNHASVPPGYPIKYSLPDDGPQVTIDFSNLPGESGHTSKFAKELGLYVMQRETPSALSSFSLSIVDFSGSEDATFGVLATCVYMYKDDVFTCGGFGQLYQPKR